MEDIQISQQDIHEPPLRRAYLMMTTLLLCGFLLGFVLFNSWLLVHFKTERLEEIQQDLQEQAWQLDFAFHAVTQDVRHLRDIFQSPPLVPLNEISPLLQPLPLAGQEKYYSRLPVTLPRDKGALIDVGQPLENLSSENVALLTSLLFQSRKKLASFFSLFPHADSILYISPEIRLFCPWRNFPPQIDLDWIQQTHDLQFSLLKKRHVSGWRPLAYRNGASDWTLQYIVPHLIDKNLRGFFALTLTSSFFQSLFDRFNPPFGRFILVDAENKKILSKEHGALNFHSTFLNEALPAGINAKLLSEGEAGKMVYYGMTWLKGYWACVVPLSKAPFKIFFVCDSWSLFKGEFQRMAHQITWEFLILVVLFFLNYWMIYRFFSRPLSQLMTHVNHERLGLKTAPETLPSAWRVWAQLISAAFQEKRLKVANLETRLQERATDLRQTIERLQNSQKQIIAQEKLVGLGTLATGIAHELKNPLHFIMNFALLSRELMGTIAQKPETQEASLELLRQNTEKISDHASQANAILNRILFHTRRQSEYLESVDLRLLAQEYTSFCYQGFISENDPIPLIIEVTCNAEPLSILCYAQELGRVFLNILGNGLDAVMERFRTEQKNGQRYIPRIHVTTAQKGNMATLSFQDNGPGIPKEYLDKIFDPFFTTKPTGQGTGLGLSLSYDFTQRHGGSLDVQTAENEGTTFTLKLPLENTFSGAQKGEKPAEDKN